MHFLQSIITACSDIKNGNTSTKNHIPTTSTFLRAEYLESSWTGWFWQTGQLHKCWQWQLHACA